MAQHEEYRPHWFEIVQLHLVTFSILSQSLFANAPPHSYCNVRGGPDFRGKNLLR